MSDRRPRLTLLLLLGALGCKFPVYEFLDDASVSPGDAVARDGLVFPSEDANLETCVPNECGGCAVLSPKPLTPCGMCGRNQCEGADKVVCKNPETNLCGGCAPLPVDPGKPCGGSCGNAVCDGTDAIKCNGTAANNKCGGCADLGSNVPGTSCNIGTECPGIWKCEGTEKVSCIGGGPRNACTGCGSLTETPGNDCGACGKYTCSADKASVTCVEAAPAKDSYCGVLCATSRYECQADRTTVCRTPDEMTIVDPKNESNDRRENGLCVEYDKAVSFVAPRQGMVTNVALNMVRNGVTCECSPCGSTVGDVVVTVLAGAPGDPTPTPIGTGKLPALSITDGWNVFPITGGKVVSPSVPMWIRLHYTGNRHAFTLYSSFAKPAGQTYFRMNGNVATLIADYMNFRVTMRACTK